MRRRWRWAAEVFEELLAAGNSPEEATRALLNDLVDGRRSSRSMRQTGRLGFAGFVYSRPVDPQHERDSQAFWVTVRGDQWLDGYRVKIDFAESTVSAGPRLRARLQIRDNLPIIAATLAATEPPDSAAAVVSAEPLPQFAPGLAKGSPKTGRGRREMAVWGELQPLAFRWLREHGPRLQEPGDLTAFEKHLETLLANRDVYPAKSTIERHAKRYADAYVTDLERRAKRSK
jgi:hypothetical protein